MAQSRDGSADKVEEDKAKPAQNIFNIVSEYPEVKHVPSQMPDSCMHEHGSINGGISADRTVNEIVGNECVVFIKHAGVYRKVDPINKHGEVQ